MNAGPSRDPAERKPGRDGESGLSVTFRERPSRKAALFRRARENGSCRRVARFVWIDKGRALCYSIKKFGMVMFTLNRSLERLDIPPSDVIGLLVSTNRPVVSVSGPSQQADAFIVSFRKGKARSVIICFHVLQEGERLFYVSDKDPVSEPARVGLEEEAVRFVEDMGFMMVQERFDGFSPERRREFITNLVPFAASLAGLEKDRGQGRRAKGDDREETAGEPEYEEVYEEVIEEVPVEEAPVKETPPRPEEYESLSDIVHEVSAEEKPAVDKGDRAHRPERKPERRAADAPAETFDLAGEISGEVASIKEMPQRPERAQVDRIDRPMVSEQKTRTTARVDPETYRTIARLLISL
jgi:hypothetical protein